MSTRAYRCTGSTAGCGGLLPGHRAHLRAVAVTHCTAHPWPSTAGRAGRSPATRSAGVGGASQGLVGDQGPAGLWIWALPESRRGVDGLGGVWSGVGGRVWLGGRTGEWWDGKGGWVAR